MNLYTTIRIVNKKVQLIHIFLCIGITENVYDFPAMTSVFSLEIEKREKNSLSNDFINLMRRKWINHATLYGHMFQE